MMKLFGYYIISAQYIEQNEALAKEVMKQLEHEKFTNKKLRQELQKMREYIQLLEGTDRGE